MIFQLVSEHPGSHRRVYTIGAGHKVIKVRGESIGTRGIVEDMFGCKGVDSCMYIVKYGSRVNGVQVSEEASR